MYGSKGLYSGSVFMYQKTEKVVRNRICVGFKIQVQIDRHYGRTQQHYHKTFHFWELRDYYREGLREIHS